MKKLLIFGIVFGLLTGCGSSSDDTKKEDKKEEEKDTSVHFVGVGDNLIHETIYQEADRLEGSEGDGKYNFQSMYKNVKDDIQKGDISFINQETIVGGQELGLSGYPVFNSPTEVVNDLHETGFNLFNLATNHSLDKGSDGVTNALKAFGAYDDITYAGIYDSEEASQEIATFEKKGITFSFLAYTYGTNGIEPANSYEVNYFDEDKIRADVAKAKEISDVVIVSAHWGDENTFAPNEFQTQYAQLFADLEVDVVIGTHPHSINPVEWIKGANGNETLVVYSLGNFIGGMLSVDNILSGMISFDFVKDSESGDISVENVKWIPLVIHFEGNQANILEERDNYSVYKLEDYTDKLAEKHVLNGYEGQVVSIDSLTQKTKEVIDEEFLK